MATGKPRVKTVPTTPQLNPGPVSMSPKVQLSSGLTSNLLMSHSLGVLSKALETSAAAIALTLGSHLKLPRGKTS